MQPPHPTIRLYRTTGKRHILRFMMNRLPKRQILMIGLIAALTIRLQAQPAAAPTIKAKAHVGDVIVVCGEKFRTGGAPVVLWTDQGGYDFHYSSAQPSRKASHVRMAPLTDEKIAEVRRDGWTPEFLRENVDQFVLHYDVDGTSQQCFKTLVKRHLSVQFMLDLDGTIYQTMDLQEEAPHATKANGRSIGIEIANPGAYSGNTAPLKEWYKTKPNGKTDITIPEKFGDGWIRTPHFVGHPSRAEMIEANVQGRVYGQYDFTPQQYDSLTKLMATLCTVFPKITIDYPRLKSSLGAPTPQLVKASEGGPAAQVDALATLEEPGALIPHALTDEQYEVYQGVLGHYHVQTDKQDPGPAFQWDKVVGGARKMMSKKALAANLAARGKPAKFIPSVPAPKKP